MGEIITSCFALILGKDDSFETTGKLVVKKMLHGNLFGEMFFDAWANKYVTPISDFRDDSDVEGYFAFPVMKEYLDCFDYFNDGDLSAYDNYVAAVTRGTLKVRYVPSLGENVMTVTYDNDINEELVIDPLVSRDVANATQVGLLYYQSSAKKISKQYRPNEIDGGDGV